MSLPTKFDPIPFHLWYAENKEDIHNEFGALISKEVETCEECTGAGYVECNLGHTHDCEECDGEGKRVLTEDEVWREYALDAYNDRVSKDIKAVKRYLKEMEEDHASTSISK